MNGQPKQSAVLSAALKEYFQGATGLIVDLSASSRPVLRKILGELGVPITQLKVVETYAEAVSVVENFKPQFIFAEYGMDQGRTALDLFREYGRHVPDRMKSVFVVLASENRPAITTALGEAEVDGLLLRPLNALEIRNCIIEAVSTKVEPTPYLKMIEAGRRFLEAGKLEGARKAFESARGLDEKPAKACFYEGTVRNQAGDSEGALSCFGRGLQFDPTHYRCLVGVFEIYLERKRFDKAYEAGIALATHYPIHPRRIPEMIRLCIINEQFTEVLRFAGSVLDARDVDETLSRYLTAGLFICAKHLLNHGQKEEALRVFHKAEAMSQGRPSVIRDIICALLIGGLAEQAEEMLRRYPAEIGESEEVRLSGLEVLHAVGPDARAFLRSQELIAAGLRTPRLFEIALLQAKGLTRPEHVVQDLFARACVAFPDKKGHFESLLNLLEEKAS